MENLIRAFIAIELPSSVQNELGRIINTLQPYGKYNVRWVPPQNIHLTINFLGDINYDEINIIIELLRLQIPHNRSFSVHFTGLGAYPGMNHPRVIWVGLDVPKSLFELQKNLENELSAIGFPKENRPFSPHLTLGRIKHNTPPTEIQSLSKALTQEVDYSTNLIELDQVTLFRSQLTPNGAVYSPLLQLKLSPA